MSTYRVRQTARKSVGGVYPAYRLMSHPRIADQREKAKSETLSETEIKNREAALEKRVKDLEKALAKFDEEEKRKKAAKAEAYKKMAEDFEKNYQP